MNKRTSKIVLLAYILFLIISVYTKPFYAESKWNHIVAAVTVTSWTLVVSNIFAAGSSLLQDASMKPQFESFLIQLRLIRSEQDDLDRIVENSSEVETNKTIGQLLDELESSILEKLKFFNRIESSSRLFLVFSDILMLVGFIIFFCILLFDPLYSFVHRLLDGFTVMAFCTILGIQLFNDYFEEKIKKIKGSIDINRHVDEIKRYCEIDDSEIIK